MYKKVFLDANVLVDVYDSNRPSSNESNQALTYLLQNEQAEIFTSCDIVTTIYYLRAKENKLQALEDIIKLNDFCTIIDFGNTEVSQSCQLMKKNPKFTDLEDTIQYVMAKKVGADLILSNDTAFVSEEIELMSTAEFCEALS